MRSGPASRERLGARPRRSGSANRYRPTGERRPIVAHDRRRLSVEADQAVELSGDAPTGERGVGDQAQARACAVVDDSESAEPTAALEQAREEVQGPAVIGASRYTEWGSCSRRPLAPALTGDLAHAPSDPGAVERALAAPCLRIDPHQLAGAALRDSVPGHRRQRRIPPLPGRLQPFPSKSFSTALPAWHRPEGASAGRSPSRGPPACAHPTPSDRLTWPSICKKVFGLIPCLWDACAVFRPRSCSARIATISSSANRDFLMSVSSVTDSPIR